tara:strand:- start:2696 stop:3337 length:642 start_codon:yes stop_codon:yes gene_type:complete
VVRVILTSSVGFAATSSIKEEEGAPSPRGEGGLVLGVVFTLSSCRPEQAVGQARRRGGLMRHFTITALTALAALAGAGVDVLAQDAASPEGQVYAVTFGDSPPVSGKTVLYTFETGNMISSQVPLAFGEHDQPGGSGTWRAEGMVAIQGNGASGGDDPPEIGSHPLQHLQLLAAGSDLAMCQSWPQIAIGESADPQTLCWITNPDVVSVERRQ